MDFIIQIYNTKQFFVKESKTAQSPFKKEQIAYKASKINGSGTYVHLMDKTDILFVFSELFRFSLTNRPFPFPESGTARHIMALRQFAAPGFQ